MISRTSTGLLVIALLGCNTDVQLGPGKELDASVLPDSHFDPDAIPGVWSDSPHDPNPVVSDAVLAELIKGNNAFAMTLYGQISDSNANLIYSPLSVSSGLAMVWAGARTSTETQIAQALHFTLPQAQLHPAMDKLLTQLSSRNIPVQQDDRMLKLILANAAWAQVGYSFLPSYLDTLAVDYNAGIFLLDFLADPVGAQNVINDWIAFRTEDKLTGLIPDGSINTGTKLVLTDALYFHGNWNTPFKKNETTDSLFHAANGDVTAPRMYRTFHSEYAEGDGWQMAEVPYLGFKLAMTIVLPAAGRFDEIRTSMTGAWLEQADAQAAWTVVDFAMPKFRFSWDAKSLVPALKSLGMVEAFDESKADLSGMYAPGQWPLFISDVLHKAFIAVDEEGTEAAAAAVVTTDAMGDGGVIQPTKTMIVDRPFLFMIRDLPTRTLLFVGQVTDPTKS